LDFSETKREFRARSSEKDQKSKLPNLGGKPLTDDEKSGDQCFDEKGLGRNLTMGNCCQKGLIRSRGGRKPTRRELASNGVMGVRVAEFLEAHRAPHFSSRKVEWNENELHLSFGWCEKRSLRDPTEITRLILAVPAVHELTHPASRLGRQSSKRTTPAASSPAAEASAGSETDVPARMAHARRSSWRETCRSASGWSPRPIHAAPAGSAMICES
jgi:hypothetical protein